MLLGSLCFNMEWYLSRIPSFVEVDMTASGGDGMSRSEILIASAICLSADLCVICKPDMSSARLRLFQLVGLVTRSVH